MVLPSSGTISLNDVNVELGKSGTTTASMDSGELRVLATGLPYIQGSTISMSDFYGDARPTYTFNESAGIDTNGSRWPATGTITVDIGAASAGRIVVIVFFTSGANVVSSVSCYINGTAATRRVGIDNNNNNTASIFTLPVSSGTTASVYFQTDAIVGRAGYSSYSVYYPRSSNDGVVDTDTDASPTTAASSTLSFGSHPHKGNVKGIFIGGFQTFDNSGTIPTRTFSTNSGNTVTNDGTIRHGTETRIHTPCSYLISGQGSGSSTVTCTFDTSRIYESIGAVFF